MAAGLLGTAGGLVGSAAAANQAATASVDVHTQFVGDASGTTFTFTVNNTGTVENIASVLISRPSSNWTVTACPAGPAGWTIALVRTTTDPGKCRYTSAAGTADDISIAGSSSAFQVRATNAAGVNNFGGNWSVGVSRNTSFGSADAVIATAAGAGLGTTAHVWEVTDAVVASSPPAVDTACPPPAKSAEASTTKVIVLCGRNHANASLTPTAAQSTVTGTFIGAPGAFASGAVAPNTAAPVVLGNWSGTTVTPSVGAGKTVVATTGSSATATSPATTLTGYTATQPNAAPVLASIEGAPLTYSENGSPLAVTSTVTVNDADSANLVGATVSISVGYQNGQDVLALASPPAGITPLFNAASGVLTLSGSASPAAYQAALRAVTYANTSDNPITVTRTVSFQVDDGAGANNLSNVLARTIDVLAVNDAPVLSNIEPAALGYAEGDPATTISSAITVADADSANLASATVAITTGHQSAEDVLALASPPAGITPSFNAATGVLSLTGSASIADYQSALRGVTYSNTSSTPNTTTRTVSFTVNDGAAASNTATRNVAVGAVNSPPVLANIEGAALSYTEGDPAKVVTSTVTVTDADNASVASATVTITGNFAAGEDVLALPSPPAGITPTLTGNTLTLSGSASLAAYQNALRGVTYANTSESPSTAQRTISFQVNDGAAANNLSNVVTRNVTVAAVNAAPVLANIEGSALVFTTGDPAAPITSTITVTDPDSATIAAATVSFSAGYQNGQDVLALVGNPGGISGAFNAATGTLALSGTASLADYQTALRAVTYQNTSGSPSAVTRTVGFQVNDGASASNTATRNIAFAAANSAPVLAAIEGAALPFTEGDAAKVVTSAITVTDADSANLSSATVSITGGFQNGQDVLALPAPPGGITPAYDGGTGILLLTGSATPAAYQAALRGVTFANGSDNPGSANRTISFQVNDGAGVNNLSNIVTRDVAVTPVNDAPVLAGIEPGALPYSEGAPATVISPSITVADLDSTTLASATVTISAGYQNGEDALALASPPAGITPAFNVVSGTLTLTGPASVADYQTALRGVTYQNTSVSPTAGTRTIGFQVNDGAAANNLSNTLTRNISVTSVNSAPVLADIEGVAVGFAEGDAAKVITSSLTVSDADNANLTSATVTISAGYVNGQDILALPSPPAGITPAFNAGTGTLTLTGSATLATYEAALRAVTYANSSENPSTATRTVTFQANDGTALSNTQTRDIAVTAVNDAPVLAGIEGAPRPYTENGPAAAITSSITVADADSANLTGATVQITANFAAGQDVLALPSPPAGITPSFSGDTLTLGGSASLAAYQTALRGVTYANTSENPSTAPRTVSFQVTDGSVANNLSNVVTRTITVAATNDAPTITLSGSTPSFTEDGAAVAVDGGLTVGDVDDTDLVSGSVTISAGLQSGDVLAFTPAGGITDTNAAADVLTLTGTTSVANWQSVLRSVTFATTNQNPSASRTVSFTVNDGDVNSATVNKPIAVIAVNDAPVLAGVEGAALTYTENAAATVVSAGITATDADSANLVGATIQITGGYVNGEDVLSLGTNPQNGITAAFNTATGTLALSGSSSVANYQAALRDVRYANSSQDPTTTARTVSFQVDDGPGPNDLSNVVTRSINVTRVNDAPVGGGDAFDALGNTRLLVGLAGSGPRIETAGSITSNDTDVDTPQASLDALPETKSSTNCAGCNNVVINANGSFTYDPPAGFTGNDTFTYTVRDNDIGDAPSPAQTGTGTVTITVQGPVVWYVDSTPEAGQAGNTGRSHSPFLSTTSLQPSNGSVDDVNEIIFVYEGTYAAANGLGLQNGQKLLGQPFGLTVDPAGSLPAQNLVAAGGSNPELRATGTGVAAIALANGVEIQRVNISNSSVANGCTTCTGVRGTAVTTATIGANTQISGNSGIGFQLLTAAGGNIAVGSQISGNGGLAVSVANRSSGTVDFTGQVSSTAGGVSLSSNLGATINFSAGNMSLATGAGAAFAVSGGGTVGVSGTGNALSTTTGTVVDISGASSNNITIDATITQNGATSSGKAVNVTGHTGGTISFPKTVSSTGGAGVSLTANGSTTVTFSSAITLSGANATFVATGTGTLNASNAANVVGNTTPATGPGVRVENTTLGSTLRFTKVSVTGGTSGIVLNNTGTSFGLSIAGTGTTDGSGGIIQNTTGAGVALTDTRFTTLKNMVIGDNAATAGQTPNATNNIGGDGIDMVNADDANFDNLKIARTGGHGIDGTGVTNLVLSNSDILNAGDADNEHAFAFNDFSGGTPTENNLEGTVTITNTVFDGFVQDGINIENFAGTLNMTVSGSTFANNTSTLCSGATCGETGLLARSDGSSVINLTVNGTTLFNGIDGNGLYMISEGSSPTASTLNVTNTTIQNSKAIGLVLFGGTGDHTSTIPSKMDFTIGGSVSVTGSTATAISIQPNGKSTMRGTVTGVTVTGSQVGRGIEVLADDVSTSVISITNNTVSNTAFNGIFANNQDTGKMDIHIRNNNVSAPLDTTPASGLAVHGIEVNPFEQSVNCVDIAGNTSAGNAASGGAGYRTRQRDTSTFNLERYTGPSNNATQVQTFLVAQNTSGTASATVNTGAGSPGYTGVANGFCADPP